MKNSFEPGRELDALVAEKVMGNTLAPGPGAMGIVVNITELKRIPPYSTDIAAAWEVVEKIGEGFTLGRSWEKWVCTSVPGDMWGCYIDEPGRYEMLNDGDYFEWADTAPHAICLAALKAIGHEPR